MTKDNKRKWRNRFLNIIIVLLLCTSVILIFKDKIREYITSNINDQIFTAYKNGDGKVNVPWWKKLFTDMNGDIKLDDSMLGILRIENLKIKEPIFQGATEINLINGVATVDENQTLDAQNLVLAGHSVQGVDIRFYNLNKIKVGEKVEIITKNKLLKYEVTKIYDVIPTQVEILEQHPGEDKKITMFTCDDYNAQTGEWEKRFVVEGKFIGEETE